MNRRHFLALLSAFSLPSTWSLAKSQPALQLAKRYSANIDINQYWVSEKLDGVRAYWDGHHLISRQGNTFNSPTWFTEDFPTVPMDGELWIGRQTFEKLSGIVRKHHPKDHEWKEINYKVFDLPSSSLAFEHRQLKLQALMMRSAAPQLTHVDQFRVATHNDLMTTLQQRELQGAEGLMLRKANSLYLAERNDDLLKLKSYRDAEATVISHKQGQGKYHGMMGALEVESEHGLRFYIGSGFSDLERKNPPKLGSIISYKYYGLTNKGTPRFPIFIRDHRAY